MGFWGIEVKPGKPHPYHSDNVEGRLLVTQATLGLGSSTKRCILQCSVGHKSPIFLCSLLPDKNESCSLNLEFKDELVAFSVIGPRSIHLSGYFVSDEGDHLRDEYDSDSGEDISNTETEGSSEFDYDDDFIDDDNLEMFSSSPVPNSGVVIEEILDDLENDKPANGNDRARQSKKKITQSNEHEDRNHSQQEIVVKRDTDVSVLESEDEDGFPIASSKKSRDAVQESKAELDVKKKKIMKEMKKARADTDAAGNKRKIKSTHQDGQPIRKKKKEKLGGKNTEINTDDIDDNEDNDLSENEVQHAEMKKQDSPNLNDRMQRDLETDTGSEPGENTSNKKKKKKKKNKKNQDNGEDLSKNQTISSVRDESKSSMGYQDKQSSSKSSQVRTFSNGLVIEELAMGKPDGKKASPGCQVSVLYIGKLKKNGKIFDSNVGRSPFKFRLGVGQVIKGWDVGLNGMRIGDKRKLTIPPSMGYGDRGAGGKIPPNSWLEFDVELVNVK